MAIMKEGNISGAVGPAVFYTRYGNTYLRTKPRKRKVKRGHKPNKLQTIFGTVTRNGSLLLGVLKERVLFHFTLATYNTGRGWMRNRYAAGYEAAVWDMGDQSNDMCQLNPASDLRDILFKPVAVTDNGKGKIGISIPAIDPMRDMKKLPAGTRAVNMKMVVLHNEFKDISAPYMHIEEYSFPYKAGLLPAKEIMMDTKAPAGHVAIIVLALELQNDAKNLLPVNTDNAWLPCAIIAMGRVKQ